MGSDTATGAATPFVTLSHGTFGTKTRVLRSFGHKAHTGSGRKTVFDRGSSSLNGKAVLGV
jgi:hypothetical protein